MRFANTSMAEKFENNFELLPTDLGWDRASQFGDVNPFNWVLVVLAWYNSTLADGAKLELSDRFGETARMHLNLYYNSSLPEEETQEDAANVVDFLYLFSRPNYVIGQYYDQHIVNEFRETQGETLPNRPDTFISFSLDTGSADDGASVVVPEDPNDDAINDGSIPDAPDPAIGEKEPDFSQLGISEQCSNAIKDFNEQQRTFGPARRCGNCLDTALSDVPGLNGTEAISEAADQGLLNSCCFLGCPGLFEEFVGILESECTEANIASALEFYRTLSDSMSTACQGAQEVEEACGGRRSDAPGEG
ncbi:hypothetical protein DUNSADRAFT_8378 [Dunaliella salina]|uniref:Uncharacterized protein n=1 Tax=Dunaliella salina TaxID=3046 RepID=A0ABQ7GJQ8_DUNSA|nr:hypothetical protein DUNSADRAFT_8378 [Dunaliella salina]|eukprot:KAF5834838.1 hypothetical protein DUNSADRAFT_8378 [Dunaliella salina]